MPVYPVELSATVTQIGADWLAAVGAMRSLDAAFAARLGECRDGAAAAQLCAEWMGHRLDSLMVAQHRLIEAWVQALAVGSVASAAPAGATVGEAVPLNPGEKQC